MALTLEDKFDAFCEEKFGLPRDFLYTAVANLNQGLIPAPYEIWAAGSSVLQYLTNATWESGDIDLYINLNRHRSEDAQARVDSLLQAFERAGWEKMASIENEYRGGFMTVNKITNITTFQRAGKTMQLVETEKDDIRKTIDRFDLTICSVGYNFATRKFYESKDVGEDPVRKLMTLRKSYLKKYSEANVILHKRVQKYTSRGYTLSNPPTLILAQTNLSKAIRRIQVRIDKYDEIIAFLPFTNKINTRVGLGLKGLFKIGTNIDVYSKYTDEQGLIKVRNSAGDVFAAVEQGQEKYITLQEFFLQLRRYETTKVEMLKIKLDRAKSGNLDLYYNNSEKYKERLTLEERYLARMEEELQYYADPRFRKYLYECLLDVVTTNLGGPAQPFKLEDDDNVRFDPDELTFRGTFNERMTVSLRFNRKVNKMNPETDLICPQGAADPITLNEISDLPAFQIYKTVYLLPPNAANPNPGLVKCFDVAQLRAHFKNDMRMLVVTEYGRFPDGSGELDMFDYILYKFAKRRFECEERRVESRRLIGNYKDKLASLTTGTTIEKMFIRGGAMAKPTKKSKKAKKSAKKSGRRRSPKRVKYSPRK